MTLPLRPELVQIEAMPFAPDPPPAWPRRTKAGLCVILLALLFTLGVLSFLGVSIAN